MLDNINIKYWELAHTSESIGYHRNDDYSARCDICGDSTKNKNQKRLHLYKKSSYENDSIKCFNCDYTGNMFSYLRDYHPELFSSYKQEKMGSSLAHLRNNNTPVEIREIKQDNTLSTFDQPIEFIPIAQSQEGHSYITKRGFPNLNCYFSKGDVNLSNGKRVNLANYVIIPLLENGKWYGFYSRSINSKKFYTYLPEENTGWKVWNWFNINKKETVYIFEAIFNALSSGLSNSIAVLGSDLDLERLKVLKDPIFCFDNDEAGRKKALKYSKLGYKISLPPKDIQDDYNDLYKNGMLMEDISEIIKSNVMYGLKAQVMLKV